jgi:esterase/lipase superfamily enzyme
VGERGDQMIGRWRSERVQREVTLVRWGSMGRPLLLLPTAGGDAEEVERMHVIGALWPLLEAGRIKVYSCDSVAGRAWSSQQHPAGYCALLQNRFDGFVEHELVRAIWTDCRAPGTEIVAAGASIGAFNAVASLCRHPELFRLAIGLSGTYDLEKLFGFRGDENFYFASPLLFVANLPEGRQLELLRQRFVLLAFGQGRWESPEDSWRMAGVLGGRGIPNRVDPWGHEYDHDWPTWRQMLPHYLGQLS